MAEDRSARASPAAPAPVASGASSHPGGAHAAAPSPPLQPGQRFDRYVIDSLLGSGGMGRVYRAHDERLQRPVALKIVHGDAAAGSRGAARVLREARAAAALRHPNAVTIYDVGEHEGSLFIAMECVEGHALRAYVGDAGVAVATRVRWLVQVARALHAAHERGLVHRDVKPENVMVAEDGAARVLDFGIARLVAAADVPPLGEVATVTGDAAMAGTPLYMAPEQLLGAPVDARTDQFAWGSVAYELLTGATPWAGAHGLFDLAARILTGEIAPVSTRVPAIPRAVSDAVARALEKEPDARFASMAEAAAALEPFADSVALSRMPPPSPSATTLSLPHQPTVDVASLRPPPETPPRTERPLPRRQWPRALVALVAVAVLAVGAAWLRARTHATPAPVTAPPRRPTTLADLPIPRSPVAAATAAYLRALVALRRARFVAASDELKAALAADPLLAVAHLRAAIYIKELGPYDSYRRHFQEAGSLRASLDEHDQALLDAFEPCFRGTTWGSFAEAAARLVEVEKRYPDDAEVAYLRAWMGRADTGRTFDRALELDPAFAMALYMQAYREEEHVSATAALSTLSHCIDIAPDATGCLSNRVQLEAKLGDCGAMEADVRSLLTGDSASFFFTGLLAEALYAEGRPIEAVREALAQATLAAPEERRAKLDLVASARLAMLVGDFRTAEERTAALARAAGPLAFSYQFEPPGVTQVRLALEVGDARRAGAIADEILKRRGARNDEIDARPLLYAAAIKGGSRTESQWKAEWPEWLAQSKRDNDDRWRWVTWVDGYAEPASTRADAEAALAARSDYPVFSPYNRFLYQTPELLEGEVRVRAGDADGAIPLLTAATGSCQALVAPLAYTQAWLYLGQALESRNDTAGACHAYGVVLARWGSAIPRSVTADAARKRSHALGCERVPD